MIPEIDLRYLFFKGLNLIEDTQGTRAGLEEIIKWTSKGKIKAIIDTVYPFWRHGNGSHKNDGITIIWKVSYYSTKIVISIFNTVKIVGLKRYEDVHGKIGK